MKKVLSLLLVLAMVFSMAACKKEEETTTVYSEGLDENGFYEGIKATDYVTLVDFSTINITDTEINERVELYRNSQYYMDEVPNYSKIAEDGDVVNIDYTGYIDGEQFDGGTATGTDLTLGSGSFIDGFEDQIVGHYPGETFDINVTFPENYSEELAGKDAVFTIVLNYVVDYEVADLTDDWVYSNFYSNAGWETVDDMKFGCKETLVENYVYENSTFADEMPQAVKDAYVNRTKADIENYASSYGLDADTYVSYMYGSYGFTTLDSLLEYYESYSATAAQSFLMYQAIAETANLSISDDDVYAYIKESGYEDAQDEMIETYGMAYIKSVLLYDKAVDYITNLR